QLTSLRNSSLSLFFLFFFFQAEDGIRYRNVTGVQTCALPISRSPIITSSTLIVCFSPSLITFASCGAISVNSFNDDLVFANVLPSKKSPNRNKKVTTADSTYS